MVKPKHKIFEKNTYDEYRIKVVIAGPSASGKSSLLSSICGLTFPIEYRSTIGVDYGTVICKKEDKEYKFCLWDTSGDKTFMPITKSYFSYSIACILVFDLTIPSSFYNAIKWLDEYKKISPNNYVILVGNKLDKIFNSLIPVVTDKLTYGKIGETEIRNFTQQNNIPYIEVSAKTKQNVSDLTHLIMNHINLKITQGELIPNQNTGLTLHQISRDEIGPYQKRNNKPDLACCNIM
jgi:small GTP-binding protein